MLQQTATYPREPYSIWIIRQPEDKPRMFYCHVCREIAFRYTGKAVTMMPGDSREIMTFPFEYKCRGNSPKYGKCPVLFIVQGVVDKEVLHG